MKSTSKFDYGSFYGGYDEFAVNAQRFTLEEATKLLEKELEVDANDWVMSKAFVKWRAGVDEDHEKCVGWWLEYKQREKGSCPVYAFHRKQYHRESLAKDLW